MVISPEKSRGIYLNMVNNPASFRTGSADWNQGRTEEPIYA